MKVSRSTEIKVGVVTFAATALLIIGILIGEGINIDPSARVLTIRLPQSGGLESGSSVMINGVKRGSIISVANNGKGVIARAELDRIDDLHADATALVSILEITGGKKLEIDPGVLPEPLDPSKEIKGDVSADIGVLVGQLGAVSMDAVSLIRRLDTVSAALTRLLDSGAFVANVQSMASDGATIMKDVRAMIASQDLQRAASSLRGLSEELREAVRTNEPKLNSLLTKLDNAVGRIEGTMGKADSALVHADSLVVAVTDVVNAAKSPNSTLYHVLYDDKLYLRIDTAVASLNRFVRNAQRSGINVNVELGHTP
jgi:ABC-type transporter Mla subunit MlaD